MLQADRRAAMRIERGLPAAATGKQQRRPDRKTGSVDTRIMVSAPDPDAAESDPGRIGSLPVRGFRRGASASRRCGSAPPSMAE